MSILIPHQTTAANSLSLTVASDAFAAIPPMKQEVTLGLVGGTLGDDEFVKLQYYDGDTWRDAITNGNAGVILDKDNTICTLYGRMINVRISKSVTVGAIGVRII